MPVAICIARLQLNSPPLPSPQQSGNVRLKLSVRLVVTCQCLSVCMYASLNVAIFGGGALF